MKAQNGKRVIALLLGAGAGLALVALMLVSGVLYLNSRSGADPANAFSEIPVLPENYDEIVTWQPDRQLIREVEPATRTFVEATLVRSWQSIDTALRTGNRERVDTWFMPGLEEHVAVTTEASAPAAVRQLGHTIEVTFYSLDGSVLGANVTSELERSVLDGPSVWAAETYEVVFLLSDGNWRIQHLHRVAETSPVVSQ